MVHRHHQSPKIYFHHWWCAAHTARRVVYASCHDVFILLSYCVTILSKQRPSNRKRDSGILALWWGYVPSIAASAIDNATPHECPISGRIVNKYIEFYFEAKKTNKFRIEWSEPCLRIVLGFIPRTQRYHLFVCRAAFMNCFLCIFIPPFPVDQKLLFYIIYISTHFIFFQSSSFSVRTNAIPLFSGKWNDFIETAWIDTWYKCFMLAHRFHSVRSYSLVPSFLRWSLIIISRDSLYAHGLWRDKHKRNGKMPSPPWPMRTVCGSMWMYSISKTSSLVIRSHTHRFLLLPIDHIHIVWV